MSNLQLRSRRARVLLAAAAPALLIAAMTAGSTASVAVADPVGNHTGGLITVGMPNRTIAGIKSAGAVDMYPEVGARQMLTKRSLGLKSHPGERFGASVTLADLNDDGLTDLLIGVPGAPAREQSGHVVIVLQSHSGSLFQAKNTRILKGPALAGDEFGAAVAVSMRPGDPVHQDIWIGAPGQDIDTGPHVRAGAAGAVYHYIARDNGTIRAAGKVFEGDGIIPGLAEADDRFGSVLGATNHGVVVGVPSKDVDGAIDAGQIVRVRMDPDTHALLPAQVISENTPGVPGTAEVNDRFGDAVSKDGYGVGIPNEQVESQPSAGAVQTFIDDPDRPGQLLATDQLNEDSPGVPGVAEAGDHFGAAVSLGMFSCPTVLSLAIGAPDEDLGSHQNAGSVTLVALHLAERGEVPPSCAFERLTQGRGLPGRPEDGDRLGAAVSVIGGPGLEEDTSDSVLLGIPGEDVGAHHNTGRAATVDAAKSHFSQSFGAQSGDHTNRSYGAVLGTESAAGLSSSTGL